MTDEKLQTAARWLMEADGMLVTAGAGMGVDSGLPDFRGDQGFWRAYPALQHLGFSFQDMAKPQRFEESPELAWGFYGHRLQLYRDTVPHEGFQTLRGWAGRMRRGAFVFTSNVDGQFQKAGFAENRIHEVHGTIHQLQCISACRQVTWPADDFTPVVNPETSRLVNALPRCPHCGRLARPNILMFWDATWVEHNADMQEARLRAWLASVPRLVVVELGAGKALPTVRRFSERHAAHRLIRINLRDWATAPQHGLGLEGGALSTLQALDAVLKQKKWSD
ncbi:SIR2 family NAD-dependent protein deacylase [Caballeronia grimmiae]|uniref:SIR2 family NAD-dependent protein deacylase n=1 Tax=Caballeronia grimmiae TaxID=1071679 RepID=UPI0038BB9717